jgi:DNA-directed RNA polymerase specialized sigma24 family protein
MVRRKMRLQAHHRRKGLNAQGEKNFMSRDTSTSEEKESFRELWEEFLLGKNSIEDVLANKEFLKRGMAICRRLTAGTSHGAEDLFVDVCVKMLDIEDKLRDSNPPVKEGFFSWFRVIALNIRRNQIRMEHRLRQLGLLVLPDGIHLGTIARTHDEVDVHRMPAEILSEIASLALEGATDEFSGRDHDSVLYPRK